MVVAHLGATDGVWNDVRTPGVAVGTLAFHGSVGSPALAKGPRRSALAQDVGLSRSWRVVSSADERCAVVGWAVAVCWKEVPGGELVSFRSWRRVRYDHLGLLAQSSEERGTRGRVAEACRGGPAAGA
eukprot:14913411-Alexandrium_andersonii.AAC.1